MGEQGPRIAPEMARSGRIVLRKRWQRGVFILGLVGAVILGLVVLLWPD
jgi:hypothetical protein